ncbi:uncharacterized protein BO88DRAFT_179539 [Aspergillus vadensis CBS 113365]|uniref:Uncharacterized protein n=1 Tax=Aspergillus vadensis (strain CBS 113365 / IMI 142717 / IBT 24658) TaxID=1448311 RepID=A0A319AY16_ASPVC|nr:hypothetical protein BO88DRAFT_179539 [Aspergillus vadensis CBS 113365]PYH64504.1 hypothetical protein BO88DRAFT_179539 [Aspergillus vadensis CBS 113365]
MSAMRVRTAAAALVHLVHLGPWSLHRLLRRLVSHALLPISSSLTSITPSLTSSAISPGSQCAPVSPPFSRRARIRPAAGNPQQ